MSNLNAISIAGQSFFYEYGDAIAASRFSTANAMAGAYEYLHHKSTEEKIDVSRLFIYYNARFRALEKREKLSDTGSCVVDAIESLEETGVCLESDWPYNMRKVNTKPKGSCYDAAADYTIVEALQVNVDENEMKSCLAQGFPIIFGLDLFTSFDKAEKKGIVLTRNCSIEL
jgi:hypothetical protein